MKWLWGSLHKKGKTKLQSNGKSQKSVAGIVADKALKQYDKTFKDLARYDRGEKILDAVSR